MAASANIENTLRTIFKRCVQCPTTTPSCPTCDKGTECSLISQSCSACAYMTCIKKVVPTSTTSSQGANVGAIAGGVVGGVVLIAAATFAFWWFFVKAKRVQYEDEWEEDDVDDQKQHSQFHMQRSERASIHTVNSVATSLFSRASAMIPIAFIPGVMMRDDGNRSRLLAPPVPPIPAVLGPNEARSFTAGDALFFKPGDLRDSTYSDASSMDDRSTFYGRPSITPSLAISTNGEIFRDDAVEHPMPAQTIIRAKANMVSLDPTRKHSPGSTPDQERDGMNFEQKSAGTMDGASIGKPKLLTLTKNSKGRFPIKNSNPAQGVRTVTSSPLAYKDDPSEDEDEEEHDVAAPLPRTTRTAGESSSHSQSPFADPQTKRRSDIDDQRQSHVSEQSFIGMGGLRSIAEVSSIIEDATRRASLGPSHHGLGGIRPLTPESPFGDEFETK